jgi:hypothetical protein
MRLPRTEWSWGGKDFFPRVIEPDSARCSSCVCPKLLKYLLWSRFTAYQSVVMGGYAKTNKQ